MKAKLAILAATVALAGCQTTSADVSGVSYSAAATGPKYGYSTSNLKTIMPAKLAGSMQFSMRSIKNKERIEFDEFHGRDAVKMTVNYDDGGHPGDWRRMSDSKPHAQRIQIQERERTHEMMDGKEYWYKMSVFIPEGTGSRYHTVSLWDLKPRRNGAQDGPSFTMSITEGRFMLFSESGKYVCFRANLQEMCAFQDTYAAQFGKHNLTNRWVDLVMQIKLVKGEELFRLWADDRLVFSHVTDLSPWNDRLGFKFGPYRHHMEPNPGRPDDDTIYYADINRSNSCEGVDDNCDTKMNDYSGDAVFGSMEVLHIKLTKQGNKLNPTFTTICRNQGKCEF